MVPKTIQSVDPIDRLIPFNDVDCIHWLGRTTAGPTSTSPVVDTTPKRATKTLPQRYAYLRELGQRRDAAKSMSEWVEMTRRMESENGRVGRIVHVRKPAEGQK